MNECTHESTELWSPSSTEKHWRRKGVDPGRGNVFMALLHIHIPFRFLDPVLCFILWHFRASGHVRLVFSKEPAYVCVSVWERDREVTWGHCCCMSGYWSVRNLVPKFPALFLPRDLWSRNNKKKPISEREVCFEKPLDSLAFWFTPPPAHSGEETMLSMSNDSSFSEETCLCGSACVSHVYTARVQVCYRGECILSSWLWSWNCSPTAYPPTGRKEKYKL